MPDPLVKYEGNAFGLNLIEERVDYVKNERTGETTAIPYFHVSSTALGDFALVDIVDALDENGKPTGAQKEVPRLDPDTKLPMYDREAYQARWSALIEPCVGKDHAPIMAGLAFKSAQVEAQRLAVVAMTEAARAEREAMIAEIDARQKAAAQFIVDKHDEVTRAIAAQKADLDAAVAAAQAILAAAAVAVDPPPMPEPAQIAPVSEPLTP